MSNDPIGEVANQPSVLKRLDTWVRLSRLTYRIPAHGRSFFFTLGGIVFCGFLLMIATGFILAQLYNPLPQQAYQSLEKIQQIDWASYVRALHYWTAQGIVVALLLHIARVFITGAYKHPRQVTWWIGVALFGTMTMGSYFSGTVLKWDQEGFDALLHYKETLRYLGPFGAALTESLPGSGPMNLRVFVSHIAVFPVLIVLLVVAHFYLIRIFNLSPTPWDRWSNEVEIPPEEMKGRFNEHARSIAIFSLIYYGFLAVVALFVRAPLGDPPSGGHSALKPPWPFLWMYGFENLWGVVAIIYASMLLFGFLAIIPLIDRKQDRRLGARKGILTLGGLFVLSLMLLTLYGWFAPAQTHIDDHDHPEEEAMDGHDDGEDRHEEGGHTNDDEPSQSESPAAPAMESLTEPTKASTGLEVEKEPVQGKKKSSKKHPHPKGTPDHQD